METEIFSYSQFVTEDDELVAKWTEKFYSNSHVDSGKVLVDELTMHFSEGMLPEIKAAIKNRQRILVYYYAGLNGGHETAERVEII